MCQVTSELISQRLLGTRPGEPDEPMLVESITRFERAPRGRGGAASGALRARNRIAMYLPPLAAAPPGSPAPPPPQAGGAKVLLTAFDAAEARPVARRVDERTAALTALAEDRAVAVYDYEWTLEPVLSAGLAGGGGNGGGGGGEGSAAAAAAAAVSAAATAGTGF